jgi:hypothetical protein
MNKNTRRKKKLAQKSVKTGDREIISQSKSRNLQMRVMKNPESSVTVFEPIDKTQPIVLTGKVNTRGLEGSGQRREWKNP